MADEASRDPGPFNVDTVQQLVKLMSRHDLSEILLEEGESRIRLRRGIAGPILTAAPAAMIAQPLANAPAPAPAAVPAPPAPAAPAAPAKTLHEIKSPMVGTLYNREKPDAEPYVKKGTRVSPNTVVGQIEAMKLFNELQAECSGVIVEVLLDNGSPVDYNTVLFRVDTAG